MTGQNNIKEYIIAKKAGPDGLKVNTISRHPDEEAYEKSVLEDVFMQLEGDMNKFYLAGKIGIVDQNRISIVGSRDYTNYGKRACTFITEYLCRAGITIVSGLMYGIDLEAHKAALASKGRTIAVLGYGFDSLPDNSYACPVADQIIKGNSGAVISQFEKYQPADKWTFRSRNRIVAALSKAVIVIEGGERSGTLITAGIAAEMGKEVFVVPGSIFSSRSVGCHALISQGARILQHPKEVIEYLGIAPLQKLGLQNDHTLSENEKLVMRAIIDKSRQGLVYISNQSLLESTGIQVNDFGEVLTNLEVKGLINSDIKGISLKTL